VTRKAWIAPRRALAEPKSMPISSAEVIVVSSQKTKSRISESLSTMPSIAPMKASSAAQNPGLALLAQVVPGVLHDAQAR
jgi:hypothetical protein